MVRAIDSEVAFRFLTEQLVKETGAFSKGVNKGLNIARSSMRNPDAIPALRPVSREQVEKVWRGEWIKLSAYRGMEQYKCSKCGQEIYVPEFMGEPIYSFCPMCSSAMMDSSVDLMIDKLGEMKFE